MPRGIAWLRYLGILLGMVLGNKGLEVWPLTDSKDCTVTGFLRDKLQYRNRLQYMDRRALRGGAENRQHHQAEGPGKRAGAAVSVGPGESQRCRVGAGSVARGPPVLEVPAGGADAAAERPAGPPGCGGQPQGGGSAVAPERPGAEPQAGAAQSPAGQLLPGHGAALLLLL
ncbi:interleukin-34 isoform X8 [Oryctolagus cuniculus]|uniref:interleukin-34 isoform X7 n=1 Tax=Oryctolagus cuniculus TaxID=9986 RepID=UPI0007EE717E